MVEATPASMEELLEHEGWVQGLARSLVHDPAAAEDLVQETWLAALRRPPMNDRPLRPWLGRVVRNFASERRRRDSRRVLVSGEIEREDGSLSGDAQSGLPTRRSSASASAPWYSSRNCSCRLS